MADTIRLSQEVIEAAGAQASASALQLSQQVIEAVGDEASPSALQLSQIALEAVIPYDVTRTSCIRNIPISEGIGMGYWWEHSVVNLDPALPADDVVLIQTMDEDIGGSRFSVWFPFRSTNNFFALTPGYTNNAANSAPDIFCMPIRDASPAASDPVIPVDNFGRMCCDFMGRGLDTHQGGVAMTAGTTPYVFNFHAGEAEQNCTQLITMTGTPTGGTFTLTFNGQTATGIDDAATAAQIQSALEGLSNVEVGDVSCSGGPLPATPIAVEFQGQYANTVLPLMIANPTGLTPGFQEVLITYQVDEDTGEIQRGQGHPDGMLWLYPMGLPRPSTPTVADTGAVDGNINGVYDYYLSYYSSMLNWESPLSAAVTGDTGGVSSYFTVSWTNPNLLWFKDVTMSPAIPGPVIDYVRIYRKRRGATLSGGIPDGINADIQIKFVQEVQANRLSFADNYADTSLAVDAQVLFKEYPPDNCRYLAIHDQHAFFLPASEGNRTVWHSEPPLLGGVGNGEFGYAYVANNSFFSVPENIPDDVGTSAVKSFGSQLVVWTPKEAFAIDTTGIDSGPPLVRKIDSAPGCASHWCVMQTTELPDIPGGALLYINPIAGLYIFDGVRAIPIDRADIADEVDSLSRVAWQDLSRPEDEDLPSWYYATAVVDANENRAIISAPQQGGGSKILTFCFDRKAWTTWDLDIRPMFVGREYSDETKLFDPIILFAIANGIYKMEEGKTDQGAPFTWTLRTGMWNLGVPITAKKFLNGVVQTERHTYSNSGEVAEVNVQPLVDGRTISTTTDEYDVATTGDAAIPFTVGEPGTSGRYLQLEISGDITTDDQDVADIGGFYVEVEKESTARGRIKRADTPEPIPDEEADDSDD